jgi:hypothetical protein
VKFINYQLTGKDVIIIQKEPNYEGLINLALRTYVTTHNTIQHNPATVGLLYNEWIDKQRPPVGDTILCAPKNSVSR